MYGFFDVRTFTHALLTLLLKISYFFSYLSLSRFRLFNHLASFIFMMFSFLYNREHLFIVKKNLCLSARGYRPVNCRIYAFFYKNVSPRTNSDILSEKGVKRCRRFSYSALRAASARRRVKYFTKTGIRYLTRQERRREILP